MKRITVILTLVLCFIVAAGMLAGTKDVPLKVSVDGTAKTLKPSAIMRSGKVLMPLKATAELMKAKVQVSKDKKVYTVTAGTKKSTIKTSEGTMVKNVLMVGTSTVAKVLDYDVNYDKTSKTVRITTKVIKVAPRQPCSGST